MIQFPGVTETTAPPSAAAAAATSSRIRASIDSIFHSPEEDDEADDAGPGIKALDPEEDPFFAINNRGMSDDRDGNEADFGKRKPAAPLYGSPEHLTSTKHRATSPAINPGMGHRVVRFSRVRHYVLQKLQNGGGRDAARRYVYTAKLPTFSAEGSSWQWLCGWMID